MNAADHPTPSSSAEGDDEPAMSSAEALLAGALALMTGYAEHLPLAAVTQASADVASVAERTERALPHLLAAKVAASLFFLSDHPLLSAAFRSTLWRLRAHWQGLERCAAAPPPEAGSSAGGPPALWLEASPTRH